MPSPQSGNPGSAVAPAPPKKPTPADLAAPGEGPRPHTPNDEKTSWIEIELVDEVEEPIPGERYRVTLPDGTEDEGTLDENGFVRIEGIDPGTCQITFPNLDEGSWDKA